MSLLTIGKSEQNKHLVGKYGFDITYISYEDNARTKNSVWGPCISDMTLRVGDENMPIIRSSNYTDLSWDVPTDKISLFVGNEANDNLYVTNLTEYLKNFKNYCHKPSSWKVVPEKMNLLSEKDTHVIASSQACFLPIQKGGECEFNVALYNYQSSQTRPAVLAIVATASGTSAQLITNTEGSGQKLYFNKNGKKAFFVAKRLSDTREQSEEMTTEEKLKNMVMVIQVPLRAVDKPRPKLQIQLKGGSRNQIEKAQISIGKESGEFPDFGGRELERDPRFPLRITLQYYYASDKTEIEESEMKEISQQIKTPRKHGENIGSLVVSDTQRPTEFAKVQTAKWWEDWWITNKGRFPTVTETQAIEKVFKNGRFLDSSLQEVENKLPQLILGGAVTLPNWFF
jgi:hypothetical protein